MATLSPQNTPDMITVTRGIAPFAEFKTTVIRKITPWLIGSSVVALWILIGDIAFRQGIIVSADTPVSSALFWAAPALILVTIRLIIRRAKTPDGVSQTTSRDLVDQDLDDTLIDAVDDRRFLYSLYAAMVHDRHPWTLTTARLDTALIVIDYVKQPESAWITLRRNSNRFGRRFSLIAWVIFSLIQCTLIINRHGADAFALSLNDTIWSIIVTVGVVGGIFLRLDTTSETILAARYRRKCLRDATLITTDGGPAKKLKVYRVKRDDNGGGDDADIPVPENDNTVTTDH